MIDLCHRDGINDWAGALVMNSNFCSVKKCNFFSLQVINMSSGWGGGGKCCSVCDNKDRRVTGKTGRSAAC